MVFILASAESRAVKDPFHQLSKILTINGMNIIGTELDKVFSRFVTV